MAQPDVNKTQNIQVQYITHLYNSNSKVLEAPQVKTSSVSL